MSDDVEKFEMPRLPGGKIDLDVREKILSRYMEGANQKEIADEFKVSAGAVRNIIKNDDRAKAIRDNKIDYDLANRTKVLNKAFAVAESLIERCTDEFRLKALVDTINVLIHTRRIEEGLTGATPASTRPFEMTIRLEGPAQAVAELETFPELSAGDQVVDANPIEYEPALPSQPVDDFT